MSNVTNRAEQFVIVEATDVDEAIRLAASNGVEVEEVRVRGIEPVTTVTLLLLGGASAVATVAQLIDQAKGGQVIDLRANAPKTVYRSRDVVYGLVLIIASDGAVKVEVKEPRGMFGQVLDSLKGLGADLGKAGVNAIAEAVKKRVGDNASVTIQPAGS
jgi:hypothetical protein